MNNRRNIPHIYKPLLPLAWVYSAVASIRNKLFDWHILPIEEFDIPIISVGNITVGGTGKTPLIEYLIELLSPQYRVAVLSRGYGRKSKGFVLADNHSTALTLGDEPFQIHSKYNNITVAVDANRRRGIHRLLQTTPAPEVILLDDALQHRYVRPSISIVLYDYNRPIYADLVLPAGRLREPATEVRRADITLITKCPHILPDEELDREARMLSLSRKRVFASHIGYKDLVKFDTNEHIATARLLNNKKVILLCGIANPSYIQEHLSLYTTQIILKSYPDHHSFNHQELIELLGIAQKEDAIIITTEKDAARLRRLMPIEDLSNRMYILPIKTIIQDKAFDDYILRNIYKR